MLDGLAEYLNIDETDELYRAAFFVLSVNLVHGNALTMRTQDGQPITFAEWGYLFHPGSSHRPSAICVFHGKICSEGHFERGAAMLIQLHKQATTTPKVRAAIQASDAPASILAERFGSLEGQRTIR